MQHLVVLEVVQQGVGHDAGLGGQEHGGAFHAGRGADEHGLQEARQVQRVLSQRVVEQTAPLLPGHHEQEDGPADQQREPAAVEQLEQVGAEKGQVHHKEEARGPDAQRQRVFPAITDHEERQYGGDQHVQCHGDAVGGRQIARRTEHHHGQHDQREQPPVHERHVDLAGVLDAGVQHLQARQVAQLDDLLGHAEGASNQRLRGDHRGCRRQPDQRHQRPVGGHHEKRVLHSRRVGQQQRALAKIVERERRHDHGKPGQADRLLAEVPHVGVERLATGHAQHDRAKNDEGGAGVVKHEPQRVMRADRPQDFRV